MPYVGDEFFPDEDERDALIEGSQDRLQALVALRRVAYFLGFDAVGDVCLAVLFDECGDLGLDGADADEALATAELRTLTDADAAGDLVIACRIEERRRDAVRQRRAA
jgi:hypothetical protein